MTEIEAHNKTIEIIEVILEEQNGFALWYIKENYLANQCQGSDLYNRIRALLESKKEGGGND